MDFLKDILAAVVFMAIVFGLAAAILWLVDKCTLSKRLTEAERSAIVDRRSARWGRRWRISFVVMAALSLPINVVALFRKTEPLFPTVIWIVLAALILLSQLNPSQTDDEK